MNPFFAVLNVGFKTTTKVFGDQKVEGRENVPPNGPVIFISNHLSNMDPAVVASLTGRNPGFLAKKELFKFPPFSVLLKLYGAHPLKRGAVDLGALRWAMKRLSKKDSALILFPEGTRNKKASGMGKGLAGVTHIALKTGAPVVPIGLTGTESLQNVFRVLMPRAKIRIKIGKPFRMADDLPSRPSREELEQMTTEIMVRIANLLPESQHGYYRDSMSAPFVYTEEIA